MKYSNLGSRLRHLLELLDGNVEDCYRELFVEEYKPKYTPIFKALIKRESLTIGELTKTIKISQPAITRTINEMLEKELIERVKVEDARKRRIRLSMRGREMVPMLEKQWLATANACAHLNEELSYPLTELVEEAISSLEKTSFKDRMFTHTRKSNT